jgi:hypothetical protein
MFGRYKCFGFQITFKSTIDSPALVVVLSRASLCFAQCPSPSGLARGTVLKCSVRVGSLVTVAPGRYESPVLEWARSCHWHGKCCHKLTLRHPRWRARRFRRSLHAYWIISLDGTTKCPEGLRWLTGLSVNDTATTLRLLLCLWA